MGPASGSCCSPPGCMAESAISLKDARYRIRSHQYHYEGENVPILLIITLRLTETTLFAQGPINGEGWIHIQVYPIQTQLLRSVTLGNLPHLSKLQCLIYKVGQAILAVQDNEIH